MNLVLTVVVIAGTYLLACLLLSALGRISEKWEREPGPDVTDKDVESGGRWSTALHAQST